MASKQIQDIKIRLGIDGAEKLEGLKSSFRDLTKTIDVTDDVISKAVTSIKDYVKTANNSEAVIKGQINAFEALKSQANITGSAYKGLDADIKKLKEELRGASDSVIRQRDSLIKNAASTKNSSVEVGRYIQQLKKLQSQTRLNSESFKDIEKDIDSLTDKMIKLRQQELADFPKRAIEGTRGAIGGLKNGVQESIELFKRLGQQSKTAFGAVARSVEGIAALGVGGAIAGVSAGGIGNISSLLSGGGSALAGLRETLGGTPVIGGQLEKIVTPEAISRLTEAAANLSALQSKVAGLDQAMDAIVGTFTAFGPAASAGAIAASAGIAIVYDRIKASADETRKDLEESFKAVDDEVQALLKDLTKLNDQLLQLSSAKINELLAAARGRFAAAPAGSPLSRAMASQIAGLEAMARQESAAQAQVLEEYRSRVRGTSQAATDLSERLSYLRSRLQEVDTSTSEGKAEFANLSRESLELSETLKKLGDSYRNVATMATQAATAQENAANAAIRANYLNRSAVVAQERALQELGARVRAGVAGTPLALPAAGGTTAPGTGQAISGGARRLTGAVETTFDVPGRRMARTIGERSGYFNPPTAATGAAAAVGQSGEAAKKAGKSYSDLLVNLREVILASNNSVSSLESQRSAWSKLRDAVDPASKQFANASKKVQELDDRLSKLQATQQKVRKGLTGMQLAQGVGAAISGGIFGGPEGLIGGLGGLAVGGVGGAFAGAAFGAQVGGLRQQLGEFAEYAAQIQKLEIALENTAGSQAEFNRAIQAASDVTKTLNVPQEVAISGMTRLSAAVKGAGGQISDAELVFKNVTAAIKGTGGAAQDVDGSVTALVQIFSKGKVSAEEINQIAERLPGTFNLIAEASGRTGPELSKALEQGVVGLDDLMKFIVELGNRYSEVAQKIAASSQDAGARLTVAFNSMRQSVGDALQPIGAEFQEAFADFVENITPFLAENLPKIAGFVLDLSKNLVPLAGAIGGVSAALAILKVQALLASGGMTALASAIGAANLVALVNPYVALAAGVGLLTAKLIGAINKQRELNNLIKGQGTLEQFNNRYQEIEGQITAAQEKLTGQTGRQAQATRNRINQLKSSLSDLEKVRGKFEQAVPEQEKITPSDFPDPTGKDSGSGRAKKERESQLPQLLAELAAAQEIARVNEKIREAQLQGNQFLQIRLEGEKNLANIAGQIKAIAFEKIPADEAEVKKNLLLLKFDESRLDTLQRLRQLEKENTKELTSGLDEVAKKYKEQREKGSAVAEMVKNGITPALAEAYYEIDKTYEKEKERIQLKIEEQRLAIAGLDVESKVRKEIEKQIENLEKLLKLRGQKVPEAKEDAAAEEERKRREKEAEEKAQRLKNLYGGIVSTIEDGIVGSFTAGIESLIEGTKTLGQALQEIASGVLKDIGQLLLRFGVNAGLRAVFPGAFAEKGAYFASGQASFAKNSIQPFAMGGIVTKPTFFKYADGGTFNNGVMGEAGPEAIMPLKRGLDGKLGVAARLDGALKRYRPVPGSAAAVAEGAELTTGSSAAGATAIDVRYNVERINNVDYVTNQEFQAGLQQAASQGAERGQQLALRRLQQSVTTRRRLGI